MKKTLLAAVSSPHFPLMSIFTLLLFISNFLFQGNLWTLLLLFVLEAIFLLVLRLQKRRVVDEMWLLVARLDMTIEDVSRLTTIDPTVLAATKNPKFSFEFKTALKFNIQDINKIMELLSKLTPADRERLARLRKS